MLVCGTAVEGTFMCCTDPLTVKKEGKISKSRPSSWAKDHSVDSGKSVNNYWKVEEPVGHFVSAIIWKPLLAGMQQNALNHKTCAVVLIED